MPLPDGRGALRNGGSNKGGTGQPTANFYKRAAELANDDTVWDVQIARAKAGDPRPLQLAAEYVFGRPTSQQTSATIETPDGFKFTLKLGERDADG